MLWNLSPLEMFDSQPPEIYMIVIASNEVFCQKFSRLERSQSSRLIV
jgi:hypothetical protein